MLVRMYPDVIDLKPAAVVFLAGTKDAAFVNTFGITRPTPENEAKAGRFIAIMLGAVLVLLGAVAWTVRAAFTH